MKKIVKTDLDTAAYYALYGAVLVKVDGEYHRCFLQMEIPDGMYQEIKSQPLVSHVDYMRKRKRLKEKIRKVFGFSREGSRRGHIMKIARISKPKNRLVNLDGLAIKR